MKMDLSDEIVLRIRGLQAIHADAHQALRNWGAWARDCRGMYPGMSKPRIWQEYKQSEADDWGDTHDVPAERLAQADAKSELPEVEAYEEKTAVVLNDRIHGPGGLAQHLKDIIRIAYVSRELPENQFPRAAGCPPHAFCERLEAALLFASRYC